MSPLTGLKFFYSFVTSFIFTAVKSAQNIILLNINKNCNIVMLISLKFDFFRKNMAVVHFYFSKSKFTPQQKGELFGFTEFLCKITF